MTPIEIIHTYYPRQNALTRLLVRHSTLVRDKALSTAGAVPHLNPDMDFIDQAAMLHDIGIFKTYSPKNLCRGRQPYIRHGVIGRELLERHGLTKHALVCERHVGVGIRREDILARGLPLPLRDMLPISIEEIIICYADAFFSKSNDGREHSVEAIIAGLRRYGRDQASRFMQWHNLLTA